ncbi:MAG: HVO_0476 family zinc finger protein [Halobacteria archaeon]
MSEDLTKEDVLVECPSCSFRQPHEVLKSNGDATVKCEECGHVHKVHVTSEREVERRVIVSQGDESFSAMVPMNASEKLNVGDEFVVDCDEGIFGVELTSIEVDSGCGTENDRIERAEADDVETVWTRVVDNVEVPVTLHRDKSEGEAKSHDLWVPGDYEFVVGETETVDGRDFEVTAFIDRDTGDRFRLEGDDVIAKNAKRVYGEER